jgi:hypothetical protein
MNLLEQILYYIQYDINKHGLKHTAEEQVNKMTNFELLQSIARGLDEREAAGNQGGDYTV